MLKSIKSIIWPHLLRKCERVRIFYTFEKLSDENCHQLLFALKPLHTMTIRVSLSHRNLREIPL